jgi:hypothetical protein
MVAVPPFLRCSTDELQIRDRIPIWREVFGRAFLNLDFQPLAERRFRQAAEVYAFGELGVLLYKSDGALTQRTKTLLADSNDDFFSTSRGRASVCAHRWAVSSRWMLAKQPC